MTRKRLTGLMFFFCFFITSMAFAAAPVEINFQGSLDNMDGPVHGDLEMTFRLYDAYEGGELTWEETQTVFVDQGIYNVILGKNTVSQMLLYNAVNITDALWLEVQVAGEAQAMSPRQKITWVPLAVRAESVSDGVITDVMMATDAVTTEKLADGAVTASKVTGGFIPNLDADKLDGKSAEDFAETATVAALQSQVAALQSQVDTLVALLANVSRPTPDTIQFSGLNVQVINGSGYTGVADGTGNLIVGYNEPRGTGDDRSGSHNIIIGSNHNYSSYGGLVAGAYNTISGTYAVVSGGSSNTASGPFAAVTGGKGNTAGGTYANVSGGDHNISSAIGTSVCGGRNNYASGDYAFIGGGGGENVENGNKALGNYSSVSGGTQNTASGASASVSGGFGNTASGIGASVSGGFNNTASGSGAKVSGGIWNTASGYSSFVGGGGNPYTLKGNHAFGRSSAILGGFENIAGDPELLNLSIGLCSSISGGLENKTTGEGAYVGGGWRNMASADKSSVSGGGDNTASAEISSVSGGRFNTASGYSSFVGGGGGLIAADGNQAFGNFASVLGGKRNIAGDPDLTNHNIGTGASVSAGDLNKASGDYANISGGLDNTANGFVSSIGGGYANEATNDYSGVTGGVNNLAGGRFSQVGGGNSRSVIGEYDWRAGGYFQDQ